MSDAVGIDSVPGSRTPGRLWTLVGITVLCGIWGSTWLVIKKGLTELPPLTGAGVRFALAAAVMLVIARPLARREGGTRARPVLVLALGLLNFACSYGLVYWAEQYLPSSLVSVLWGTFPILMAVSGHWFLPGERLGAGQWLGLAVAFVGVVALFWTDVRTFGPDTWVVGLWVLLSPAVSVVGQTLVKRHGTGTSSVLLNRDAMVLGTLALLAGAALFERDAPRTFGWTAWGSLAYLALFGTVVTFGLYFWLLRYAPSYQLSLIAYVVPVIALWVGATLGDEPVHATTIAGTGLVIAGIALVSAGRRRAGAS